MDKQTNKQKMWYIQTLKMNKVLTHTKTWRNLEHMLSERSQIQRPHVA